MGKKTVYDAIVVGSGATGGLAVKELTERGMRVLLLEAGRKLNPTKPYGISPLPYDLKYRNLISPTILYKNHQPIQSKCYACDEYGHRFFINDVKNPYTTHRGKPFDWIRARQVGGRTIMWGRHSYRFSDYDFKAASLDGHGENWPISYKDLEPYYERVERFIGVSGSVENLPQLPDSIFIPPMELTFSEMMLKVAVENRWKDRKVITARVASYFNSVSSTLPLAIETGLLTLRSKAIASHILVDSNTGKAKGVAFIDQITKKEYEAFSNIVVLCASTIESARLLLNSSSRQYPNGLGNNSSNAVGCYLMDHTCVESSSGIVPAAAKYPYKFDDGVNVGVYIPRFRNIRNKHPKFIRGYGIQALTLRRTLPTHLHHIPGFGGEFKEMVRETPNAPSCWIGAFG
ncbi:MAG: GMC family oxidoreductase N-terminal domain-containing protein, partial [Pyrinomonadaceae bacterium]